jgi:hypothetical protein
MHPHDAWAAGRIGEPHHGFLKGFSFLAGLWEPLCGTGRGIASAGFGGFLGMLFRA